MLSANVNCFLVLTDVPQLRARVSAVWPPATGSEERTPSHAMMRNSSSRPSAVSVVYGDPTTNSFIDESPSDRVTARTPIQPALSLRSIHLTERRGLTVHAVVHDEAAGVGDALRLLRIRPLVVISQSNGPTCSTGTRRSQCMSDNAPAFHLKQNGAPHERTARASPALAV